MTIAEINAVARVLKEQWHVRDEAPPPSWPKQLRWRRALGSQERPVIERWLEAAVPFRSKVVIGDLIKHRVLRRNTEITKTLGGSWYDFDVDALEKWQLETALCLPGAE